MLNQSMVKTALNLGKRNKAINYHIHTSQTGLFVALEGGAGFLVTATATIKLIGVPADYYLFDLEYYGEEMAKHSS